MATPFKENISLDWALKKKLIGFSSLAILFLLAALLIHYLYGTTSENISTKIERTENVIREKEAFVKGLSGEILSASAEEITFPYIHQLIPVDLWENKGAILFVYKSDSLVYWSGNDVPDLPYTVAADTNRKFIRFGNGWFKPVRARQGNMLVTGLILVKSDYPYQNDYLKNEFQEDFYLPVQVRLDTVPGKVNIRDTGGDFLFSLEFPGIREHQDRYDLMVFFILAASLIFFLVLLFYIYHLFDFFRNRPWLLFLCYTFDVLLIRLILLVLKVPGFLYETDIFSPYYYATSFISPSLGDLVVNSIIWLLLAWVFYQKIELDMTRLGKRLKKVLEVLAMAISALLFYLLITTMRRMIVDSSFDLTLNNIFGIDKFSIMGFLAVAAQFLAFFLFSAKLSCLVCKGGISAITYAILSIVSGGLAAIFFSLSGNTEVNLVYPALFLAYLLSFLYFAKKTNGYRNISGILFFIVLFSLIGTVVLDYYQELKEKEKRKIMSAELSTKRDPMMEYEYKRIYPEMVSDTSLQRIMAEWAAGKATEPILQEYLKSNYFKALWDNYEQLITLCSSGEILEIQPTGYLVNCYDYFDQVLLDNQADTVARGLYFFNNRSENNNYIAVLNIPGTGNGQGPGARIFVELYYKYIKETGLGYPDLLIDKRVKMISGLSNYSYSRYFKGSLVYKYGDFSYHLSFKPYYYSDSNSYFIDNEGYNHYVNRMDEDNILIISHKNPGILDLVAPFSYLFILFSLFLLLFVLLIVFPGKYRKLEFNFSNQLQLSIILIIVVSFFILGVITRSRIIHLNNDKNRDILSEKTFSVLTELEHKIGNESRITPEISDYLKDQLYKFSTIFYSDINLYDPQGNLIVSSRPQIFEEDLLSEKMNTEAFLKLAYDQNLLYIQNEKIGEQEYLSAYIPFRNNYDQIIAYLNLPYFAKQTEIRKELSDFLVAYVNVYVLLIVLAIMVTVIVSRFVTRPLQLIREKLGGIGLGKANEKIEWERKDEIGSLVEEYNRMVDELARSAELLASSERESAWREMAKQVAHEIKNPLTPMKLSVQYLKKAWDEKAPDWDSRLERFSATIVEQIDSLSQIASEFSDFAKMPVATLEKIELTGIIKDAVNLYQDIDSIRFVHDFQEGPHFIEADKRQLLRVFNNLIQNAVQAIGERNDGVVRIQVAREAGFQVISVTDNGVGISEEQAARMFTPSFTTKSSGMGLGLAMVKSIITSIGGTVSFTSEVGNGATFILKIPEYKTVKG